ncbi:hypothetical protein C8R44DRAFT_782389 [Mycena epipterygia]|nr:hypothetical protein C8R44DRAFT_782389 [Mycena epipterygia]
MNYSLPHPLLQHRLPLTPTIPRARRDHALPIPKKPTGTRIRAVAPPAPVVASRAAPLLDVPAEIGLEIMQLALIDTPANTLAVVSKAFSALVSAIIYKLVVLDCQETIALFHRTVRTKSPEFLDTHVLTLAVTSRFYSTRARAQLEEIVAACTGVRTLAIPRPGILASALISHTTPRELIIQKFDAVTPFEWDPLFNQASECPAAHLSVPLTHLRICEPGTVWHSPLSTLEFFGPLPHLTHLALARHVNPDKTFNDTVFVEELRTLLTSRPGLKMLVVNLFPARWPKPTRAACSLCSHGCICKALINVTVADKRLVLLTTGWDTLVEEDEFGVPDFQSTSPRYANHGSWRPGAISFWENWRVSDKRVVSLATGWEPEISPGAVQWTYPALPNQLRGRHNFWEHWLMPE